jgi:hypothetical protein
MSPVSVREVTVAFKAVPVFDGLSFNVEHGEARRFASAPLRSGAGGGSPAEGGDPRGVWTPIDATRSRQPWNSKDRLPS